MSAAAGGLTPRRFALLVGGSAALLAAALLAGPLIGPARIDLARALAGPGSTDYDILFRARLPRVLLAAVVGGALATSGVVFQAILRNPLASPFTLGVSGGSALGAVLAIRLGWEGAGGLSPLPLAAFAGALLVVVIVHALARTPRRTSPVTLLLAGVILNFICSALILLTHYFADLTESFLMLRWTMGGLDVYRYGPLLNLAPFVAIGLGLLTWSARQLNALSAGEEWAQSRGVPVARLVTLLYFGASLLTGSVVAYAGPIGFVGLIVPHALRLLIGADHRVLLPASFGVGGAFLIGCDAVARTVLAPVEMPVGVVTACVGGPFFLWLLLARRRELIF